MILVLRPGIEPRPLTVEAGNLNHWTARRVLLFFFFFFFYQILLKNIYVFVQLCWVFVVAHGI